MFNFKKFTIDDTSCGMKLSTDSELLGAWTGVANRNRILDLGCGCGILALMMAQRNPNAMVKAIDISQEAVNAANANVRHSPWPERIEVELADASKFEPHGFYDLVICNPPYFSSTLISPDALRAMARHGQGLSPFTALEYSSRWLTPEGALSMVTPIEGWQEILFQAEMLHLRLRRKCMVNTVQGKAPTRVLWEFSRQDGPIEHSSLDIRLRSGGYSSQYASLTSDFYLDK